MIFIENLNLFYSETCIKLILHPKESRKYLRAKGMITAFLLTIILNIDALL